MTQAWNAAREDPALRELLRQITEAHTDESDAYVYAALRPRTGAMTEAAAIDEVRSLLVDAIPPDERRHDPTLARPRWTRLTVDQARAVFETTLSRDLAYDSRDVDEQIARDLTDRFFNQFDDDAYFLTVGRHTDEGKLRAWTPLTIHTLDTGVAAIDDHRIGVFWKTGED